MANRKKKSYPPDTHAPTKGKTVNIQAPTDDEILTKAQEIKAERGISLVEAMDIASAQLTNGGKEVQTTFELKLELKPRVAKFFRESFAGHPTLSVEERLSLFIAMHLNQLRGQALAQTRVEAEIGEGQAATIRRSTFLARGLGS